MALIALERVDEAIDCCVRCLEYDPDNKGVALAKSNALKAKEKKEMKAREVEERLRKDREAKRDLHLAFRVMYHLRTPCPLLS